MKTGFASQIRKAADLHDVHIDQPLTDLTTAYLQSETEFIAARWFPIVTVQKQSDRYFAFPKQTFFRNRSGLWVPGTAMPQSKFDVDNTPSYSAQFRAFEYADRWDLRDNADSALNWDRAVAEFTTRVLLLGREIDVVGTYFKAGVWNTNYTGGVDFPVSGVSKWDDYAGSTPIEDVRAARMAIKQSTGFTPNTMVMSEMVYEVLADHPDIKELYKYTQAAVLTPELVARAFRVPTLLIGGSIQITSVEGAASETYDWIYGKHCWLGYIAPRPALMTPSAGYIFGYRPSFATGFDIAQERIPDRRVKADFVQALTCYDPKVVGTDLGAFFANAVD